MIRRTLWENGEFACPIVGTCLTVAELRKLCRKCGDSVPETASAFDAHTFLVGQARETGRPAKLVQKFLDRKYHRELRVFRKVTDGDALRRLWREYADAGNVPGALWALLSLPETPAGLVRDVIGEVHMLSHRLTAASQADLTRLAELEEKVTVLSAALDQGKATLRQAVAVWKSRCRQAMEELAAERNLRRSAERERISLRQAIESSAVAAVSRDRDSLRQALTDTSRRLEATEAEAARQAVILERTHADLARTRRELDDRDSEVAALEASLFAALGDAAAAHLAHAEHHLPGLADPGVQPVPTAQPEGTCPDTCGVDCACRLSQGNLTGKRVLYVGGRCSLVAHYKLLAAKFGCELLHHDGGREQSAHRLWELLGSADAVVCPVDCVSHEACSLVKQACKGCLKPLILARSSGLSSLARSLTELGGTAH